MPASVSRCPNENGSFTATATGYTVNECSATKTSVLVFYSLLHLTSFLVLTKLPYLPPS